MTSRSGLAALSNIVTSCPAPFLNSADFPHRGGYINGRNCDPISDTLSCCLPCPVDDWVYTPSFRRRLRIAYWLNVPSILMLLFLLATFACLPPDKSHVHYLNIGLVMAIFFIQLSFIIPLAKNQNVCFDEITPHDMHSDTACAFQGAMLEVGTMAACVWILLRSLWTNLRVVWDKEGSPINIYLAHLIGWGIPLTFLTIMLTVSGLSYRLGQLCLPNPRGAVATWFGPMIAFGGLGAVIQLATTGFCFVVYTRAVMSTRGRAAAPNSRRGAPAPSSAPAASLAGKPGVSVSRRVAWKRVSRIMQVQWRSIVLSIVVIIILVYFGIIYITSSSKQLQLTDPDRPARTTAWSLCLILFRGDQGACIEYAKALDLNEEILNAAMFMAGLIGLIVFALMVRWSMFTAWWALLSCAAARRRRGSGDDFIMMGPRKRMSLGRPLASERAPPLSPTTPPMVDARGKRLTVPGRGGEAARREGGGGEKGEAEETETEMGTRARGRESDREAV